MMKMRAPLRWEVTAGVWRLKEPHTAGVSWSMEGMERV